MSGFRIQRTAGQRLDAIFVYTRDRWGQQQAEAYINSLFARFADIAARRFPWQPVPVEFGVTGYVCRHERHFIYWKLLADGTVGIVTILHERMHQLDRFRDDQA